MRGAPNATKTPLNVYTMTSSTDRVQTLSISYRTSADPKMCGHSVGISIFDRSKYVDLRHRQNGT